MSQKDIFDILLLIARPAAGKSEIIDYLKDLPLEERRRRFHVGSLDEIDDFPMLWTWFEEDALLFKMGHPRLYTDSEGYFLRPYFWDLLIERIGLEYQKKQRDRSTARRVVRPPGRHTDDVSRQCFLSSESSTTLIEFSRGREHGGYRRAFSHLSAQILERTALLYVDVSWEESLRKNKKRFNPGKPDSILEHSLPDAKLERLYKETDWAELTRDDPHYLSVNGIRVPYAVFDNSDDVTTRRGDALGSRLEEVFSALWTLYADRSAGM
ncbi:MAG: hypothetical protein ABSG01_15530 [Anaerolineales bacterium]|jgi:hypothetical protein